MPTKQRVDLVDLFGTVTRTLAENRQSLDQLDEYNHDHGDNMVQTFQTITTALEKKRGSSDSAALGYAARQLARNANSSSSKLYAENLAQAAVQFKGRRVDEKGALDLLTTLIGAGQGAGQAPQQSPQQQYPGGDQLAALMGGGAAPQQPSQGGDLLGALLGGLGGTGSQQPSQGGGDLLGSLLGGLTGQGSTSQSGQSGQGGLSLQNLLAAGLAYMQAKQTGQGGMQALLQAAAAGSGMGNSAHREQSTQVVVQAFLQALSGMKARQ